MLKENKPKLFPDCVTQQTRDRYGLYVDLSLCGIVQRFRWIKAGSFTMGSPISEPWRNKDELLHFVTLTKGFWFADTPCTQQLWEKVMGSNPSEFILNNNNPVENVTWDDVQEFISTLNNKYLNLKARLPTEAEWEYSCRRGTKTAYSFTKLPQAISPFLHRSHQTFPVKNDPCDSWGLYDLRGNTWEWCQDWYGNYLKEYNVDPVNEEPSLYKIVRGGCWLSLKEGCRSALRFKHCRDYGNNKVGFRLVLTGKLF